MTRKQLCAILLLLAILQVATGCIRSRLEITSNPPDATVWFSKVGMAGSKGEPAVKPDPTLRSQMMERGETPISIPFIWNWYYDIELTKEGYQPLRVQERLRARPWLVFPLDFFAEIMPVQIPDVRKRHYVLKPLPAAPAELPGGDALPLPAE